VNSSSSSHNTLFIYNIAHLTTTTTTTTIKTLRRWRRKQWRKKVFETYVGSGARAKQTLELAVPTFLILSRAHVSRFVSVRRQIVSAAIHAEKKKTRCEKCKCFPKRERQCDAIYAASHGKGTLNEPKDGARTSGGSERRQETDLAHLRVHYAGLLIRGTDRGNITHLYIYARTRGVVQRACPANDLAVWRVRERCGWPWSCTSAMFSRFRFEREDRVYTIIITYVVTSARQIRAGGFFFFFVFKQETHCPRFKISTDYGSLQSERPVRSARE